MITRMLQQPRSHSILLVTETNVSCIRFCLCATQLSQRLSVPGNDDAGDVRQTLPMQKCSSRSTHLEKK